jgi:elongation factor Ts
MHIAATKPEAIDINDLDPNFIEREKNVQRESIISSGKPDKILEKILEGKMNKFYSEVTLLNQSYIINPDQTVREAINQLSKDYSYRLISYKLILVN